MRWEMRKFKQENNLTTIKSKNNSEEKKRMRQFLNYKWKLNLHEENLMNWLITLWGGNSSIVYMYFND